MLLQIKEVGFEFIEIGYDFTEQRLNELIPLLSDLKLKVLSIHNFCPLPPRTFSDRFMTDYYRLSSKDEEERSKAVYYTKRSIDTASSITFK